MSRVRLIDIYNERFNEPTLKLSAAADIEVVPRKIIEMIIEKCKEIQDNNNDDYDRRELGKWAASDEIKEYAELLLKQFEEEK